MTVVATTTSKYGGTCQGCARRIARGEPIFKLDTGDRGGQTSGGNGLGAWVCAACAAGNEKSPA